MVAEIVFFVNFPGTRPSLSLHQPEVMLSKHDPPKNWHTSTIRVGGRPQLPPLRLVLPKRTEYQCSQCSPHGQPASMLNVGSDLHTHPLLLILWSSVPCAGPTGEPVRTPRKWGRDRGTTLTPCEGPGVSIFSCWTPKYTRTGP